MYHKLQHKAGSASTTFAPCCSLHLPFCSADKWAETVLLFAKALCPRCLCILYCKAEETHCMHHKLQRRANSASTTFAPGGSCRASSCIIACYADTAAIVCYNMLALLPIADVCFSAIFACLLCAPASALQVRFDETRS